MTSCLYELNFFLSVLSSFIEIFSALALKGMPDFNSYKCRSVFLSVCLLF